jgi:DNA end-binding protein Ku
MARAVWSGSISFGLVNVPVKAYTAVRDHEVRFHQIDKKSGARVRYEKVSEKTNRKLDSDDIEMGYEVKKGRYVSFTKDELAELRPRSTRMIEVSDFVPLADIDPIYYERTYWLGPDGPEATRAYGLLFAAMEDRERVGIGSVVMRNKQYLAAVRPLDGVLAMSTLRFADEVVARSEIDGLPSRKVRADGKELRLATQIIDALESEWKPDKYHDTYTEELRELIARRAKGETVVIEEAPAETAKVVDLMAALSASVEAAKRGRKGSMSKAFERAARELVPREDDEAKRPARRRQKSSARKSSRSATSGASAGKTRTARRGSARKSA